jgi:hypothetical protein
MSLKSEISSATSIHILQKQQTPNQLEYHVVNKILSTVNILLYNFPSAKINCFTYIWKFPTENPTI